MPSMTAGERMKMTKLIACAVVLVCTGVAQAGTGKLVLTGGVSSLEGAAGGGITPWGVIGTQATEGEWGTSAFASRAQTQDYKLTVLGGAIAWSERVEFSMAQQRFDTGPSGVALGLPGLVLKQNIVGLKVRVAGDAVLDSDSFMPSIAVGLQHKQTNAGGLKPTLAALGAKTSATDVYVSATKLFLNSGILINATMRATQANQMGLLGFGSARKSSHQIKPEISVAYLLRKNMAVGVEWRAKPDNLNNILGPGVLKEDSFSDVFFTWSPTRQTNLVLAHVQLGQIAPPFVQRNQRGWYLSGQISF
jgi:hypothetical protein